MKLQAIKVVLHILLLIACATTVHAATQLTTFDSEAQAQLYAELLEEYRCLKCQNQNLADSRADLAGDLRNEIRDQVLAGNTRAEIDEYLVARYGDFVLYRPPLKASTLILWFGPFLLLLFAAWYAVRVTKKNHQLNTQIDASLTTDNNSVKTARSLLDE